jgi:hypothetical protein
MQERTGEAPLAEVASVKETAERLANGETPEEADQVRVLAGLVHQLAEQVEKLERARGGDEGAPPDGAASDGR